MDVSWLTVLLSVGLSAVVSLLVAGAKAGREEQGKRRAQAEVAVRTAVENRLFDVREYRRGRRGSMQREGNDAHLDDWVWCGQVLKAATELGWIRRTLVQRRLKRLVGSLGFEEMYARPGAEADRVLSVALAAQLQARRVGKSGGDDEKGFLDHALHQDPKSRVVKRLVRKLDRLSHSW